MSTRKKTNYIVVHCSDTPPTMLIGRKEIDRWHKDKGWDGCGYHYIIRRNGEVEQGRRQEQKGAHVYGHNHDSVGICVVGGWEGGFDFARKQMETLASLVYRLKEEYPRATVLGHCNLDPGKTCPNFDVQHWWDADEDTLDTDPPLVG